MASGILKPGEFLGAANSLRVADAILSEVTHLDERELPPHAHEWPYVRMLLRGFYSERVAPEVIDYAPFTAVFHGAHLNHEDHIGIGGHASS
jgi:hypothetical protein